MALNPHTVGMDLTPGDTRASIASSRGALSRRLVVLLAALMVAITVYWPGLDGPFLFDDQGNILRNPGVRMQELSWEYVREAALSIYGTTSIQRPLARLSYALNYYFAGKDFDATHFKVTNLAIHLTNALIVLLLVSLLLKALRRYAAPESAKLYRERVWNWFPLLVATVWLLHPIQLTSILYVVQRMTSMAGTGVLIGLVLFTYGRMRCAQHRSWGMSIMALGVGFGTVLGVASKENAILTPLFACLIELFFFDRETLVERTRRRLKLIYGLLIGLLVVGSIAIVVNGFHFIMDIYEIRNFTPLERLMTQPRVLFFYLGLIFLPNIRSFGLFHDHIALSESLFSPWTTWVALIALGVMVWFALRGVRRRNLFAFGVLWFLVGHSVESSIVGLELVHEHRNYIPSFGPIFALCYGIFVLLAQRPKQQTALAALILCFVAILSFVTYTRASAWESRDGILFFAVRNHPQSYRAHMGYAAMLQSRHADILEVYAEYQKAAELNPYNVLPVVRLQRIISGVIKQFEEGSLTQEPGREWPDDLSLVRSPLYFEMEYMRSLDRLAGEEIAHRVSNYALDAESSVAMNELRQCVGSAFSTCPPAASVEYWLDLILARDELTASQQMIYLVTQARVANYQGDGQRSVALMEQALGLTNNDVSILIEMALFLNNQGDLEGAYALLDQIAALVAENGRGARHFEELKGFLEEQKANQADTAAVDDEPVL